MKRKILLLVIILFSSILGSLLLNFIITNYYSHVNISSHKSLKTFTAKDLVKYNGDNSQLPIYLALNGYVYDVSSGRKYYAKQGTYHWLAGKDSSEMLNIMGANIIKKKYPIVGIYKGN